MFLTLEKTNIIENQPDYLWLNTCFYKECVHSQGIDAFTEETLKQLDDFSKTIEEPWVIGQFNNEQHYLKTLELVLNSTLETYNRVEFFQNEIIPKMKIKKSLLDIGPGDGALTKTLATYFGNITAIDPNRHILYNLQQFLPSGAHYSPINETILDVKFKSETYDLAILSHVLYYVSPLHWLEVVKSVYAGIKKEGYLVIVMGGDELGKAELIQNFGGNNLSIDELALNCCNEFGAYNTYLSASNEAFISLSKNAMFHIAAFMLGDVNITTHKDLLNQYIERKLKRSDDHFVMTTRQKYIVIQKME